MKTQWMLILGGTLLGIGGWAEEAPAQASLAPTDSSPGLPPMVACWEAYHVWTWPDGEYLDYITDDDGVYFWADDLAHANFLAGHLESSFGVWPMFNPDRTETANHFLVCEVWESTTETAGGAGSDPWNPFYTGSDGQNYPLTPLDGPGGGGIAGFDSGVSCWESGHSVSNGSLTIIEMVCADGSSFPVYIYD